MDCHFLLQRIFLIQGSNPGLLRHRQISYHLSYREVPYYNLCLQDKDKLYLSDHSILQEMDQYVEAIC